MILPRVVMLWLSWKFLKWSLIILLWIFFTIPAFIVWVIFRYEKAADARTNRIIAAVAPDALLVRGPGFWTRLTTPWMRNAWGCSSRDGARG